MSNTEHSKGWFKPLLLFVVLLLAVFVLYTQKYAIHDWWRLRSYTPSNEIIALADDTTMNNKTRNVFYAYHPSIEPREDFNAHCRDGELTIVLGCYSSVLGIHIFDVEDERLDGIMQVTAAHELLHATYERLTNSERKRIDSLTKQVYDNLDDQRITDTVNAYRERDPSVVQNELHSILATEVMDLPDELEEYYSRYFNDRSRIVEYSRNYESAFSTRKEEAARYESTLLGLKKRIEDEKADLEQEYIELQNESNGISAAMATGNSELINFRINSYNQRVQNYNSRASNVSEWVDEYNSTLEKYNSVVLEQKELLKSMDSRPDAI